MTRMDEGFWAGLDKQIADAVVHEVEKSTPPSILPVPALVSDDPEPEPAQVPAAVPEWSGILDTINEARVHAEAQRDQLLEQAETFRQTIQEMSEDAEAIRQQICVSEARVEEAKAALERQVAEIQVQAEERVRTIQAKADVQIAQACSSAQTAEERASTAESWLKRLEEATRSLTPRLEVIPIRRAA
jgi:chromosome segregation ATPase